LVNNNNFAKKTTMTIVKYKDLGLISYKDAWDFQEKIFDENLKIKAANRENHDNIIAPENHLFFCEHPHVYTLGKSGSEDNLLLNFIQLQAKNAEFFKTNRGGDITYHGPGQIVGYPIIDLEQFDLGIKDYIYKIEESIISFLKEFDIKAERLDGATGVWLDTDNAKARKICAIGVKASRHITMHGFAFNINTDLDYFNYINPCGFTDKSVTSLEKELGIKQDFNEMKKLLKMKISKVFQFDYK
jgi:lipoyl(octanoyl) transferase